MAEDVYEDMIHIDGFEAAILGTGTRDGEHEVLVYDGVKAAEIFEAISPDVDIPLYLEYLKAVGEGHRSPIFVYLDENVSADVTAKQRSHIH